MSLAIDGKLHDSRNIIFLFFFSLAIYPQKLYEFTECWINIGWMNEWKKQWNVVGRENRVTMKEMHVFHNGFILSLGLCKNSCIIIHCIVIPYLLVLSLHYCEPVDRNFALFIIPSILSIMSITVRVRQ